jgi:integrase/recombinase XerD
MNIKNPCCVPQLFKSFKNIQQRPRKILDKETVDEIIFNSKNTRDRLILELQARCGLRVGEVLNLKVSDVSQQKLMLQEPKSGREVEVAFMPEHIANRLADYIASRNLSTNDRVFGICYTTRAPGQAISDADRLECMLFSEYDPYFEGDDPPGL